MDCMEGMSGYPDKYFDLAVVDPPYGIDVANMTMGVGKGKKCSKISNRKWIKKNWDISPDQKYFTELFRVSKDQMIWGGNYFNLPSCKFYVIWDKEIPNGLSFSDCEFCWTSFDKAPRIFRYSAYLDKKNKFHPTQKPVKLYDWILTNYAKPGMKILDTHVGSGSSRIAADKHGMDFIGYELDADYWKAQEKRYAEYKAQLKLF